MSNEFLRIALYLSHHPIINEPENNRIKYLDSLYWVVLKYSQNSAYATSLMKVYQNILIKDLSAPEHAICMKPKLMDFGTVRFKWFKFYTYRYIFIIDCLFINAFFDINRSRTVFSDLLTLTNKRFRNSLIHLYDILYGRATDDRFIEKNNLSLVLQSWLSNREFMTMEKKTILVTANMGAGKSTLINSLVGKRVNRTKQETCTAKIHYIYDKPFEDGFSYELDHILDLNANIETLMNDNVDNETTEISVGTFYRAIGRKNSRYCIIDTPGVDSSQYPEHKVITESAIHKANYDKLIYVANCERIGTLADKSHLLFLSKMVDKNKIIFVLNKLDSFKKFEDSISETVTSFRNELAKYGFQNSRICPVSAYAAWLAKKSLFGEKLNEEEEIDLQRYIHKFQNPEFDLSLYFDSSIETETEYSCIEIKSDKSNNCKDLLRKTGILNLENLVIK